MHIYANPKRFLSLANWLTPLLLVSGLVLSGGALAYGLAPELPGFLVALGFNAVPPDRLMGETVRIIFLHVPAAWLSLLALGLGYLWVWIDPQGLSWHDRLSGTRLVVLEKASR